MILLRCCPHKLVRHDPACHDQLLGHVEWLGQLEKLRSAIIIYSSVIGPEYWDGLFSAKGEHVWLRKDLVEGGPS